MVDLASPSPSGSPRRRWLRLGATAVLLTASVAFAAWQVGVFLASSEDDASLTPVSPTPGKPPDLFGGFDSRGMPEEFSPAGDCPFAMPRDSELEYSLNLPGSEVWMYRVSSRDRESLERHFREHFEGLGMRFISPPRDRNIGHLTFSSPGEQVVYVILHPQEKNAKITRIEIARDLLYDSQTGP
jgi:hypothetical protein